MAKVLTTPTIVVIQTLYFKRSFSLWIQVSLAVTCVGVMIASYSDVTVNLVGTLFALMGVLTASLYQIWIGTKQKELEVDSFQLLYYQAPLSGLLLLMVFPLVDDFDQWLNFEWTVSCLHAILFSCACAFMVNLSTFLIIGKTSPITYNVIGHSKLCIIIVTGFIIFHYPILLQNILGIMVTLTGVFWYSYLKLT